LQLDGTYHNLGGFLERVSKFPRIINVTGIHIKAKPSSTPGGSDTISAEATATTFVLIDPKNQAPAAPAAPSVKRM
jgi:Tfp pilus assembly protein PilO